MVPHWCDGSLQLTAIVMSQHNLFRGKLLRFSDDLMSYCLLRLTRTYSLILGARRPWLILFSFSYGKCFAKAFEGRNSDAPTTAMNLV